MNNTKCVTMGFITKTDNMVTVFGNELTVNIPPPILSSGSQLWEAF